jgi:hypothetical protein
MQMIPFLPIANWTTLFQTDENMIHLIFSYAHSFLMQKREEAPNSFIDPG